MVCLFGIPASLALVVLSESLITTQFYQGEMTQRDVAMSALSLSAYGIGLLGHMFVKVLAPGYYARQDMSTPVRYGIIALVANMVLNLLLVWHFKHAGLALATSLSAFLNAGLLFYGLRKQAAYILQAGWFKLIVQLLLANGLMVAFLLYASPPQEAWFEMGFWVRLFTMLAVCGAGGIIYGLGLLMVGIRFKEWVR
jgi:putative peptidoglycan lipid II flippase